MPSASETNHATTVPGVAMVVDVEAVDVMVKVPLAPSKA